MTTTRVTTGIHLAPEARPLVHLSRRHVYVELDGRYAAAVLYPANADQAEALSEAFASAARLMRGDAPFPGETR